MSTASSSSKAGIVLVHGLFADGSCYSKVIPALEADGHEVVSVQNCLESLEGDVDAVRRALGRVNPPAILVGHSYGGTVITAAGTDDRVAALVYIAALAPDSGETSQTHQEQFPKTEIFDHVEPSDGHLWMRRDGTSAFCGDLSDAEQALVYAVQGAPSVDLFTQRVAGTAWHSKPSWYIIAKYDRTVSPELQRFAAQRMAAIVTEVASSHVVMLSHPEVVIEVIRKAAKAIEGAALAAV